MKKNYCYWMVLLALLLGGCTDNEVGPGKEHNPDAIKDAYTSVTIQLPTVKGMSKVTTVNTDDGTANEYAVKDLTLLFFSTPNGEEGSGTSVSEGDYVLSEVISTIPGLSTGTSSLSPSVIPSESALGTSKSFKTGAIAVSKNYVRVLALVNASKVTELATGILNIGSSFKDINKAVTLVSIGHLAGGTDHTGGFLMVSAPLLNQTSNEVTTLYVCDPKPSADEATNNPVRMQVERIVAKVELKIKDALYVEDADGKYYVTVDEGSHKGDKINILGWTLGNTNTQVFPFRVAKGGWKTEFTKVWNAMHTNERLHWAEDPNYNYSGASWPTGTFSTPSTVETSTPTADDKDTWKKKVEYCLENTCHYSKMYRSQVTRVIVKAEYIPAATASVAGGNNTKDDDGTWWSFTSVAAHYSATNLYINLFDKLKQEIGDGPNAPNSVTVDNNKLGASGGGWSVELATVDDMPSHYRIASASYTNGEGSTINVTSEAINSFDKKYGQIQKYDKGICYYDIFIRHFTNSEGGYDADWQNTNGYAAEQEGRYGVVRNNWYIITINSIRQQGEPNIPIDKEIPVDVENAYIDCDIMITPWAKRNQEADL